MKKMISLMLSVMITLSLCACAQEAPDPQLAQQQADFAQLQADLALVDQRIAGGDYEGSIAILNNTPIYRQITDRLSKAEKGKLENMLSMQEELFGKTWYALDRDMQVTFHNQPNQAGQLTMEYLAMVNEQGSFVEYKGVIPYTADYGICTLSYFTDFESIFAADVPVFWYEQDGRTVLQLDSLLFVSEDAAKPAGLEMVEITMDNWQEYFEIKTVDIWEKDDFGDVSNLIIGTYIALKEEYLNRVDLKNSDVTIGYSYDWKLMYCTLNLEERTYWAGGVMGVYGPQSDSFVLPDHLGHYRYDLPDYLGGLYYGSFDSIMNVVSNAENYQITKIAGTLAVR